MPGSVDLVVLTSLDVATKVIVMMVVVISTQVMAAWARTTGGNLAKQLRDFSVRLIESLNVK